MTLDVAPNDSTDPRLDLVVLTQRWNWRSGEFVSFCRIVRADARRRLGGWNLPLAHVIVAPGATGGGFVISDQR